MYIAIGVILIFIIVIIIILYFTMFNKPEVIPLSSEILGVQNSTVITSESNVNSIITFNPAPANSLPLQPVVTSPTITEPIVSLSMPTEPILSSSTPTVTSLTPTITEQVIQVFKDIQGAILNIGQSVKCDGTDTLAGPGAVYRYDGSNKLQHYPSPTIATSWDYNWRSAKTIDCSKFNKGDSLNFRLAPLKDLNNGQSVKCNDPSSAAVYRYDKDINKIRQYPNPTVAKSWDPLFYLNFYTIDCNNVETGDLMTIKPS